MEFLHFKNAVAAQFEQMKSHPLYRTNTDKDTIWNMYLDSYPEGTNVMFRQRREHDCNTCKQFIRNVGNVVAIVNGKLVSIWDCQIDDPTFQTVASALSAYVKSQPIADVFFHFEATAGVNKNFQQILDQTITWNHFHVNIPRQYVKHGADIPSALAGPRNDNALFQRGLKTLTLDAIDTVIELIGQNSLYRGEEHKRTVTEFRKLKVAYDALKDDQSRDVFCWERIKTAPGSVIGIRNTVIGTLLVDLSEQVDLEQAVRSFESKVAPSNYKRSKAVVTPKMIENARQEIEALGLTSALQRRFCTMSDINVNNVLFVDRNTKNAVEQDDVFGQLATAASGKSTKKLANVEQVTIDRFLSDVVPKATMIEVLFDNTHANNMVSLIAPADPSANNMFKWGNRFSWSYAGEFADSIKERVKAAGGSVEGDLCCRLAWSNYDDLDFHMKEPDGNEICFRNKRSNRTGGQLDVDMNAGSGTTREPVENIFYSDRKKMIGGTYSLYVHNFNLRESRDVGFTVQVEFDGEVYEFHHPKAIGRHERIHVCDVEYDKSTQRFTITAKLHHQKQTKQVWGIDTQTFHRVKAIMHSPNHWDGEGVGNKHVMFLIEGCANDGSARGFFNEFLKEDLMPHRKVLEMVGAKLPVAPAADQLSGLGFSTTQKHEVMCRVHGSFTRTIKVVF